MNTTQTFYDEHGSVSCKMVCNYDDFPLVKTVTDWKNGPLCDQEISEYICSDEERVYFDITHLVKKTRYNKNGNAMGEIYVTVEYEGMARPIKGTGYDANGAMTHYAAYEFFEDGTIAKETWYRADGHLVSTQEYYGPFG